MRAKLILTILSLALTCFAAAPGTANAQEKKPNIVVNETRTRFQISVCSFISRLLRRQEGVEKNNASA